MEGLRTARETALFRRFLEDITSLHGAGFTREELEIVAYLRCKTETRC